MVTRMQEVVMNKFQVRLQAEEGGSVPGEETVAFFAIANGNGEKW
jgi:hypothetical protein